MLLYIQSKNHQNEMKWEVADRGWGRTVNQRNSHFKMNQHVTKLMHFPWINQWLTWWQILQGLLSEVNTNPTCKKNQYVSTLHKWQQEPGWEGTPSVEAGNGLSRDAAMLPRRWLCCCCPQGSLALIRTNADPAHPNSGDTD